MLSETLSEPDKKVEKQKMQDPSKNKSTHIISFGRTVKIEGTKGNFGKFVPNISRMQKKNNKFTKSM